ncbi:MAG: hypothetical protein M5U01_22535 [Ardenticatenaceae bacterium]|nr:hypothetical protein [Ardenticatenaceae bacterium]
MDHSTSEAAREAFVAQMGAVAAGRAEWMGRGEVTLEAMEQEVLRSAKGLGNELLSGLCGLGVPRYAAPEVACACGGQECYQRMRAVQTKTIPDTVTVRRAYSVCAVCNHGVAPLDEQLGLCPGGLSAGLAEMVALLGVSQDSFAQAVAVLARLSLVPLAPNSARAATETLGALALADEEAQVAAAWRHKPSLPPLPSKPPERLSISMDGVLVNIRGEGWKETKLGACSTTTRPSQKRPKSLTVHAQALTFVADLGPAEPFGRLLWLEAYRRGATQATELVVLGDGAEWIWRLADEHFPVPSRLSTGITPASISGTPPTPSRARPISPRTGPSAPSTLSGTAGSPPCSPTSKSVPPVTTLFRKP